MMKRIVSMLLAVLSAALLLASCGEPEEQKLPPLDRDAVKCVTALSSPVSSYLYVIEDAAGLDELVDFYNGITYVALPAGEEPEVDFESLFMFEFYDSSGESGFGEPIASLRISSQGYLVVYSDAQTPGKTVYQLTSRFRAEQMKTLLKSYDKDAQPTFDAYETISIGE